MGCGASAQNANAAAETGKDNASGGDPKPAGSAIRGNRKPKDTKAKKNQSAKRTAPRKIDWSCADADRWELVEKQFDGQMHYRTQPVMEEGEGAIEEGIQKLKDNACDYMGIYYQTSMTEWPADQQKYALIKRTKSGFGVTHVEDGAFTFLRMKYQALDPNVEIEPDQITPSLTYQGNELATPLCPGRGKGVADVPMIKIIGDVDPNDVAQGGVGDCWLLSAISALAEFDGAVTRLFAKSGDLSQFPHDEQNTYTVTLFDLKTWEPVDIVMDESLCSNTSGEQLLGCTPTPTGELWVCYLEKAVAIHCGGWDKIDGGQCTHAWRMLTGCKKQYTFRQVEEGKYGCYGAYNPNDNQWEELANSPHDGFKGLWPMEWPEVGGGGALGSTIDFNDMFERMCAFDDTDYIMGCGTKSGSDEESTDGIVDGHAYTILECVDNAGGTEWDLIKVRNPWGKGEFKSGKWDDDGAGWDEFPAVKDALNPVQADDGVFWVSKDEFFQYFKTIYLCAKSMTDYAE